MKWMIGAVVLALIGAVVSGRVPVAWVVYTFSALFISMALALFFAFARARHHGLLLMGICYGVSAALAIVLVDWWPLVAGFAIVWVLRAMGLDPTPDPVPGEQAQAAPSEEKKD
jgi:hypothetical protein